MIILSFCAARKNSEWTLLTPESKYLQTAFFPAGPFLILSAPLCSSLNKVNTCLTIMPERLQISLINFNLRQLSSPRQTKSGLKIILPCTSLHINKERLQLLSMIHSFDFSVEWQVRLLPVTSCFFLVHVHQSGCHDSALTFRRLTVEEHIYFYARLKGCSRAEVKMETDQMIEDVGLPHKRKEMAKNLSGASIFWCAV